MAFSYGNAGANSAFGASTMATHNAQTQTGPDLEEIQTEALGFLSIAGEAKVRLLPSPWPSDALPPPTSSLMSTASSKGIVAAAGPDVVVIASTESVRQAFAASDPAVNNIKPFSPELTIPVGTRISHVAFSADENFLVISAENGGGLAVYELSSLMQGNIQTAFELSTNGVALRTLLPNPTPEKAELFAAITTNGDLMMANLKTRQFLIGVNGQVMKNAVSCASWSTKGKQLVAGLGNGTGLQMTPTGEGKAEVPRPPGVEEDQHVSSISWLENNVFLTVHTPSFFDPASIPTSSFHLVTRQPPSAFMYQRLQDPCPPYGLNRSPPFHFIQRIKEFPPNIQDILIVASTASTDIGVFSRSKAPLTSDAPAEKVTNVFTTTGMANDSRRAQMSMTEDMNDTSPIGVALDLSSKEKVRRPLVGEEIEESATPLPGLMVLNNEGILASWWIVYSESVRQGMAYPGLAAIRSVQQQQPSQQSSPFTSAGRQQQPPFGQAAFGSTTSSPNTFGGAFGKPSTPAFDATNAPFGMGQSQSPWGTSTSAGNAAAQTGGAAFGKPAFGSATPIGGTAQGTAFGATGGLGNRSSPWGGPTSSTATSAGSTFGQPGGLGMRTASVFGGNAGSGTFGGNSAQTPTSASEVGGFGSYAKSGGFATAASQGTGESLFGKGNDNTSFGSGMDTDTSFGGTPRKPSQPEGLPGIGGTGAFSLGTTFKRDDTAKDDDAKPENTTRSNFFGDGFGKELEEAPKTPRVPETKETDMEENSSDDAEPNSTTPTLTPITPVQPKSPFPSTAPPATGGLFGTQAQSTTTPASVQNSVPASTEPQEEAPEGPGDHSTKSSEAPSSPKIKPDPEDEEARSPEGVDKNIPEAPVPPDPTSKTSYAPGDSSASSISVSKDNHDDAPLPPDFIPSKDVPRASVEGEEEHPTLSSDDDGEGLDEDGSGEDVAQDLSPNTDTNQSFKVTPESSFGAYDRSPVGGLFTNIQRQAPQQNGKSLFGEIEGKSAPIFPPPNKVQQSPRSPSPVRTSIPSEVLRPDNARSVSAPGLQTKAMTNRKTSMAKPEPNTTRPPPKDMSPDRRAARQAKRLAEEEQDLSDREDEKVREELETEVEATLTLAPFLAHQDYVGNINKPGIPGQIEKVYRDINSMIDTLGLNARSLEAFIKGHEEMYKDGGRTQDDLEDLDDGEEWCLIEIEDLTALTSDTLPKHLEESRVQDVKGILNSCKDLQKDLTKLRAKHADIKRSLAARSNPDQLQALRSAPLSPEKAVLQHDLRRDFTHLLKLLVDAEEAVTMLKAKLASHSTGTNKAGKQQAVPTVEAVLKTVRTMTSMAEKKSGDIDVLESQFRKLGINTTSSNHSATGRGSRESSPYFGTPPPSSPSKSARQIPRTPASAASSTLFYTPRSSSKLNSSTRTPSRVSLNAVTPDDVKRYRDKAARRREVCRTLREAVGKVGVRIRAIDDE